MLLLISALNMVAAVKSAAVVLAVTGDVNFNLNLTNLEAEYPWGNLCPALDGADLFFINHESTAANLPDPLPNDYKYEDPFNLTSQLLEACDVSLAGQSNNHQFDFWDDGLNRTMQVLAAADQAQGGLFAATSAPPERGRQKPVVFNSGLDVAVFSFVAQLCHKDPDTGLDILDSCTCGIPTDTDDDYATPGMPPEQCYGANQSSPGLWYLPRPLSNHTKEVNEALAAVAGYRDAHPSHVVVVNIHAGPNFEWEPAQDREQLLRNFSLAGADLVWGTSSHHLQRMERGGEHSRVGGASQEGMRGGHGEDGDGDGDDGGSGSGGGDYGTPIIFGLGDLLFRFIPGVDKPETCEQGMSPCEQFRPELSVVYEFNFSSPSSSFSPQRGFSAARPSLTGIRAHPTKHDSLQTQLAQGSDRRWVVDTFNNLSAAFGYVMREDEESGDLRVVPTPFDSEPGLTSPKKKEKKKKKKKTSPASSLRRQEEHHDASAAANDDDDGVSLFEVFVSGTSSYSWSFGLEVCYRIPALLRLRTGVLLAFAAERIAGSEGDSCSDESASNIVLRRSQDGGETWGDAALVLPSNGAGSERAPWALQDANRGRVFLFANKNATNCSCGVFYTFSDDEGASWSEELVELPDETSEGYYGSALATGITHRETGRLVGCMRRICRNSCPAHYNSKAFFSDDGGRSWSTSPWLANGTTECQVAELASGDLYLSARPYEGWEGAKNVRLASWSSDAGSQWGPVEAVPDLVDFGFGDEGSVVSDPENDAVYFTHPLALDRSNLTLYSSQGNATAWAPRVTLYAGEAAYSSAAVLDPGSSGGAGTRVATLFEADGYARMVVAVTEVGVEKEAT